MPALRRPGAEGPAFAVPHGIVLFIGILCFIVFLAEGAMLDWSAVFLTSLRGVDPSHAGLGYAAFALTMTVGRLTGDRIVREVRPRAHHSFRGAIAQRGGLALATLAPSWMPGSPALRLSAQAAPTLCRCCSPAVGRQKTMPEHVAVPAISTLGYAGILVGPGGDRLRRPCNEPALALLGLAGLLVAVAASGRFLRV